MIGEVEATEIAEAVEVDLEADQAVTDLAEEGLKDEGDLEEESLEDLKENLWKCIMLPVINAEKNAKFHLNLQEVNQFYAVIVLEIMKVV